MTGKKASLTVFVMRHGERLDEALKRQRKPVPRELKIDPPLTSEGHLQAQQAFRNLAQALEEDGKKRKIAFFSSPTRRTIGTSLMLSQSPRFRERPDLFDLNFFLEEDEDDQKESQTLEESTTNPENSNQRPIPITVLNGLGSCAAAVHRCGGGQAAAQQGHLPCADLPANNSSPHCPISTELREMHKRCEHVNGKAETGNDVQYWKVLHREMHPMTKPLLTKQHDTHLQQVPTVPDYCQQRGNEYFWEALDRAVLLAASKGCDTLVVVSHREGVREMLDRWGNNGFALPPRLNYCCIASYKVKVYEDRSCRWCFHGVTDFEDFSVENVPNKQRWMQRFEAAQQPTTMDTTD